MEIRLSQDRLFGDLLTVTERDGFPVINVTSSGRDLSKLASNSVLTVWTHCNRMALMPGKTWRIQDGRAYRDRCGAAIRWVTANRVDLLEQVCRRHSRLSEEHDLMKQFILAVEICQHLGDDSPVAAVLDLADMMSSIGASQSVSHVLNRVAPIPRNWCEYVAKGGAGDPDQMEELTEMVRALIHRAIQSSTSAMGNRLNRLAPLLDDSVNLVEIIAELDSTVFLNVDRFRPDIPKTEVYAEFDRVNRMIPLIQSGVPVSVAARTT